MDEHLNHLSHNGVTLNMPTRLGTFLFGTRLTETLIGTSVKVTEVIHKTPSKQHQQSGILQAWMPTIKKHNCRLITQQTAEGTTSRRIAEGITYIQ